MIFTVNKQNKKCSREQVKLFKLSESKIWHKGEK